MVKAIFVLHRGPGWDWDAFTRYWLEVHAPLATNIPGLRRYIVDLAPSAEASFSGVAEMWFDDEAAFHAGFASPEGRATVEDGHKLFAMERQTYILAQDHVIIP